MDYRAVQGADGEEDLAISTTPVSLTIPPQIEKGLKGRAVVQNRAADLLYKINGLNPTAEDESTGQRLYKPASLIVVGVEMRNLRMVRATAIDSAVHVRYEYQVG